VEALEMETQLEVEPAHSGLEKALGPDEAAAVGVARGSEEEHGSVEAGGGAEEDAMNVGVEEERACCAGGRVVGVPFFDELGSGGNALVDECGGEGAVVPWRWRGGQGARHHRRR
jgi:hypothetical protein